MDSPAGGEEIPSKLLNFDISGMLGTLKQARQLVFPVLVIPSPLEMTLGNILAWRLRLFKIVDFFPSLSLALINKSGCQLEYISGDSVPIRNQQLALLQAKSTR